MFDFILFLKTKIRAISELEDMCSVFTFVQDIFECYRNLFFYIEIEFNRIYFRRVCTKNDALRYYI